MNTCSITRILVIDDDPAVLRLFRRVLETRSESDDDASESHRAASEKRGGRFQVETAASGMEGIRTLDAAFRAKRPFAIAFVDLMMPKMNGIQTVRLLRAIDPTLMIVVCSASEKALCMTEVAKLRKNDRLLSLRKPLHPVEIRQAVRFLTGRKRVERALRRKSVRLDTRVTALGCLHAMSRLMEDSDQALPGLLTAVVELIPTGFRRPDRVSARLVLHGQVHALPGFRETQWKLAVPIMLEGRLAGALEVCCIGKPTSDPIKAFSAAEKALVADLASRLGEVLARKEAEARLSASEARYRALFETSRDAIMVIDPATGRYATGNPAALELFGVRDEARLALLGPSDVSPEYQPDGQLSTTKAAAMIERALRNGANYFEWTHRRLDGTEFPATVLLARLQLDDRVLVQATVRDVTRQKQLQAELAQAQRLEAIGQLAAGIAHEINTPTQYIGDNTRFLGDAFEEIGSLLKVVKQMTDAEEPPSDALLERVRVAARQADLRYLTEEIPRAIEQSLDGIERVAKIVRAMKEFSHPGGENKTAVDLNRIVESTLTVCRSEWKYVAELVTDFDVDLPLVPCMPAGINQAVLNMVINAAHAISEKVKDSGEKGTITVRTRRNDDVAEIHIEDNGAGIPESLQTKIFDMFFTTKPVGQGTGQGLPLAQQVVIEGHGGTIECRSKLGQGATFIIRLPLEPLVEGRQAEDAISATGQFTDLPTPVTCLESPMGVTLPGLSEDLPSQEIAG